VRPLELAALATIATLTIYGAYGLLVALTVLGGSSSAALLVWAAVDWWRWRERSPPIG